MFASYLDTAGMPDPDLLIRTSGELSLSNYLLWQLAYTEFYVTDCLWPDFDQKELEKAIVAYNRQRPTLRRSKADIIRRRSGCLQHGWSVVSFWSSLLLFWWEQAAEHCFVAVTALISLIGLFELYRVLKIEKNTM